MLKKHLIPGLIISGLFVMANVFAYRLPTEVVNLKKTPKVSKKIEEERKEFSYSQLQFADETLPLGDVKVLQKMKRTLSAFSFDRIQSARLHKKAAEWFPIIEPILAVHGIPNDFKYVVLVESGLRWGVSPKGAAGYWQFMPGTARSFGLKVSKKNDERYDLEKSTLAAAKYLTELYQTFDSWTLVAAAFNLGDTRLRKQIMTQGQDNYFKMKLNRETGAYVYKIISVKEVLENPHRNGYVNQKPIVAYQEKVTESPFVME
jgi:hypothetical protein